MEISINSEMIEILKYVGDKIGITIDWTADNVLPIIQELTQKFIKWETATSATWIIIATVLMLLTVVIGGIAIKFSERSKYYKSDIKLIACVAIVVVIFFTVLCICCQIFDIVECSYFPEKTIYDYLMTIKNRIR